MDENYIRHRVNEILQQKIAMGGCGPDMYGYGDYEPEMHGYGVVVGGKGTKRGARKNPWLAFLQYVAEDLNILPGQVLHMYSADSIQKAYGYDDFKLNFVPSKTRAKKKTVVKKRPVAKKLARKPVKRAPSKRAKKRPVAKKLARKPVKRAPSKRMPTIRRAPRKLTPTELARTNRRYAKRSEGLRGKQHCYSPDDEGNYYLYDDYACLYKPRSRYPGRKAPQRGKQVHKKKTLKKRVI